jgi:hypothetical protein
MSTPHRGTHLAETLNRILQVSFVTNPMQFIAELAVGSQTLQKLNEQFRHVAPKLQIVSFYETRPTKMFKKTQIVSKILTTRLKWMSLIEFYIDGFREGIFCARLSWRDIKTS